MKLILAADERWGIGRDGGLLCHLPGDLKYFKSMTMGKTVIMGRVTLQSLPGGRGLPGRRNIVMTRDCGFSSENCEIAHTVRELDALLEGTPADDVFVIGGASIYEQLLPKCDTCYITRIYEDFGADRSFCDLDGDPHFDCEPVSDVQEENGIRYRFYIYKRR